jgi:N-acetylglutamate synthase-like GNAT family acetyltransferase
MSGPTHAETPASAAPLGGYRIERTGDLAAVRALGIAGGLDDSDRGDEAVLAAWMVRDERGELVGAVALEVNQGLETVNWMAVTAPHRRRGLASALLHALEGEAARRGIARVWATARTPELFLANGFRPLDEGPERDILLVDCPGCAQYGRGCSPVPMVKEIAAAAAGAEGD